MKLNNDMREIIIL